MTRNSIVTPNTTTTTSSDGTLSSHDCRPSTNRLVQIMAEARVLAEQRHSQKQARKALVKSFKPDCRRRKQPLSKRAESSLRSAEICREKQHLYSTLLERELAQEEETYLMLLGRILDQTAANMRLAQQVADAQNRQKQSHFTKSHNVNPMCTSTSTMSTMVPTESENKMETEIRTDSVYFSAHPVSVVHTDQDEAFEALEELWTDSDDVTAVDEGEEPTTPVDDMLMLGEHPPLDKTASHNCTPTSIMATQAIDMQISDLNSFLRL